MVWVFANGQGDQSSIPDQGIPKTPKIVLDCSLLNIQCNIVQIKSKWSNQGKGVAPTSTPWCSSFRKEAFRLIWTTVGQLTNVESTVIYSPNLSISNSKVFPEFYMLLNWKFVLFWFGGVGLCLVFLSGNYLVHMLAPTGSIPSNT